MKRSIASFPHICLQNLFGICGKKKKFELMHKLVTDFFFLNFLTLIMPLCLFHWMSSWKKEGKKIHNPLTKAQWKWSQFERETPIFKIRPVAWTETMLTTGPRFFLKGILSFCLSKGCKVIDCQTLRMLQLSGTQSWATSVLYEVG